MKYLRLFNSHSDYDAKSSSLPEMCVVFDNEHIHYIRKRDEEPEQEPTKYKLTVEITNTDFGETSVDDFSFEENASINESIEYLSAIYFESSIYNADTNEEITDSSITVTANGSGFDINGTMPNYNVKISITVSSLA